MDILGIANTNDKEIQKVQIMLPAGARKGNKLMTKIKTTVTYQNEKLLTNFRCRIEANLVLETVQFFMINTLIKQG